MLKGEQYDDPQFPANPNSICKEPSDWKKEWNELKWERAVEILNNNVFEDNNNSDAPKLAADKEDSGFIGIGD